MDLALGESPPAIVESVEEGGEYGVVDVPAELLQKEILRYGHCGDDAAKNGVVAVPYAESGKYP